MTKGSGMKITLFRSAITLSCCVLAVVHVSACGREGVLQPRMTTSSDGVPISYVLEGSGAPVFVFVHGWACDRTYWSAQVEHFSTQARVITVDLAGHGESGDERADWSIANFAEDVVAVLVAENIENATLVGHSLGGPVVLEAAILASDRVSAVVGVDAFPDAWPTPPFPGTRPSGSNSEC